MNRYYIPVGGFQTGNEASLVSACGAARDRARAQPGARVVVECGGVEVARYRQRDGKLEGWVR